LAPVVIDHHESVECLDEDRLEGAGFAGISAVVTTTP